MKVWEKLAVGIKWDVKKEHIEKTCSQLDITPCDIEDTVHIIGVKPICSHKCNICLALYIDKEIQVKEAEDIDEGQLCLF